MSPKFIVITGADGTGKSTQVGLLARVLGNAAPTAEPGGTWFGEQLRALVLSPDLSLEPRAVELLFAADRAQHVTEVIRPALAEGLHVVCSRWVESSAVYRSCQGGLSLTDIYSLSEFATDGLRPDLTILLDPTDDYPVRLDEGDRIEAMGERFQVQVRRAFRELALTHRKEWVTLAVTPAKDEMMLHQEVREAVRRRLGV